MKANLHIEVSPSYSRILIFAFLLFSINSYSQNHGIKNGVNIQASYYNRGTVNLGWDLMKTYPEIEAVRIEIEPYRAQAALRWIREAHMNGYQVIATYHDSNKLGSGDKEDLLDAAEWWVTHYQRLSTSGPIIINVMNEWGSHEMSEIEYADAYNEAIKTIRTVYDGQLIVDVPGFGQATTIAADAYEYFEDQNIVYSVHIYSSAFNIEEDRWLNQDDLSYLEASGAACMVGEFCDAVRGGADWCTLVDHCYDNGWPLFGWAWNGDGGNMNMIEPHWRDLPLANSFEATPFMDVIIDKLSGVSCFSIADEDCNNDLIGTACNDNNEYTINDRYNESCHCTGIFSKDLSTAAKDPSILIYPNPVESNQQMFLEFFKINRNGVIKIYNIVGQDMITIPVDVNDGTVTVDTQLLPNGIYWASFLTDDDVLASKAFIKI